MNQRAFITEFKKLTHDEKATLLDVLWDEYRLEEDQRAPSDAEVAELDRRMAAYRADPTTATDSEEVFREMRELIATFE